MIFQLLFQTETFSVSLNWDLGTEGTGGEKEGKSDFLLTLPATLQVFHFSISSPSENHIPILLCSSVLVG